VLDFVPFPSIARLSRECVVTEKIDGTNAQILITESGEVRAGSRTRWITPEADNFGFAAWVWEHRGELLDELGVGQHFGEWWGSGIQRRYGLDHKRFSLFNVTRWADKPEGHCHVVPTLYRGPFDTAAIDATLARLALDGSVAAPGFRQPEGVVVFHAPSGHLFKKTLDKNDGHKGGPL
jgi:hypothetical protein